MHLINNFLVFELKIVSVNPLRSGHIFFGYVSEHFRTKKKNRIIFFYIVKKMSTFFSVQFQFFLGMFQAILRIFFRTTFFFRIFLLKFVQIFFFLKSSETYPIFFFKSNKKNVSLMIFEKISNTSKICIFFNFFFFIIYVLKGTQFFYHF